MFLIRGLVFTHEAVRDWEAKLAPRLTAALRRRRRGKAGRSTGPWREPLETILRASPVHPMPALR